MIMILLNLLVLLSVLAFSRQTYIEAFSPSAISRPLSVYSSSRCTAIKLNTKNKNEYEFSVGGETVHQQEDNVTVIERTRVLSYRAALISTSALLSTVAIFDSNFLVGTGLDGTSVVDMAEIYLPFAAGTSLLLAPASDNNNAIQRAVILLGLATCVSGIASVTSDIGEIVLSSSSVLGIVSLVAVSIREIIYFGVAYKWEAAVALICLPLLLLNSNDYETLHSLAAPLSALSVSVLAVGKVFEPCKEEFVKTNSEFLAE